MTDRNERIRVTVYINRVCGLPLFMAFRHDECLVLDARCPDDCLFMLKSLGFRDVQDGNPFESKLLGHRRRRAVTAFPQR